ncbi:tigger transposable element-derived protein 1, partial [Biomphalaria glabrata]
MDSLRCYKQILEEEKTVSFQSNLQQYFKKVDRPSTEPAAEPPTDPVLVPSTSPAPLDSPAPSISSKFCSFLPISLFSLWH